MTHASLWPIALSVYVLGWLITSVCFRRYRQMDGANALMLGLSWPAVPIAVLILGLAWLFEKAVKVKE